MKTADTPADGRMDAHEALCAVRYQGIIDRVSRLEGVVIAAAGSLIVFLAGLIVTLLVRLPAVH